MYNRYTPQADGSYQRNRLPDTLHPGTQNVAPEKHRAPEPPPQCMPPPPEPQHEGILSLFKNLLPKNIDTGDLIIVLLILLMSNDCEKDRNHALLTLALYFFL